MRRALAVLAVAAGLTACGGGEGGARFLDRADRPLTLAGPQAAFVRARVAAELAARGITASSGLEVRTTIDPDAQAAVATAVSLVPSTGGRFEPVALLVDPRTGEVRGLRTVAVPGTATDALDAPRPSGSTMKVVALLAAVRTGYTPESTMDGSTGCVFSTPTGPFDATDAAATLRVGTLRQMAAKSINCAFALIAESVGPDALARAAADLGLAPPSDLGVRFALGANAVTPVDLTTAMATLLADGVVRRPHLVRSVRRNGHDLALAAVERAQPSVAQAERDAVLTCLADVLVSGTAAGQQLSGSRPAAGKTGTQAANTDAWFTGGTPSFVATVWLGNPADQRDGMQQIGALGGKDVRGAGWPTTVWRSVLEAVSAGTPIEPLPAQP